uniref:Uncharacterized protein LOC114344629 n=1 Tax=Diabrotica virgifera virgifera TaxID=50390 RepID=A0A6P7GYR1_DIAVI
MRRRKPEPTINYAKLKDENTRRELSMKLNKELTKNTKVELEREVNLDNTWRAIEETMTDTVKKELGYKQKIQKKSWMTDEILAMFEERRKHKNQGNRDKYREQQQRIRREISELLVYCTITIRMIGATGYLCM